MRKIPIIFFLFLFNTNSAFTQATVYRNVDSIMRQYKEKIRSSDELYKVVYFIRNTFDADSLRLRASFIWITENISYDVEGFEKEDPRSSMLNYVIKNKKAVCGGYAGLLKFFCDAFRIDCVIITGRARAGKRDVNISQSDLRSNHAWNAVKINNNWRLIDPTWATGVVDETDENNLKFYKSYAEEYYFTSPEKMIFNHFPDQYQYQYLTKAIPSTKFKKWPLFTTIFIGESITEIYPDTVTIKAKVGDTIHFRMKTHAKTTLMCVVAENYKKPGYWGPVTREGEWLKFDYPVKASGNYNLYLGYCLPGIALPLAIYRFEVR